jgi:hypothetical protein
MQLKIKQALIRVTHGCAELPYNGECEKRQPPTQVPIHSAGEVIGVCFTPRGAQQEANSYGARSGADRRIVVQPWRA